ncbi:hypothetical protein [Gemmatimonas phototrophica]|uniref:hypothetical protein n=1 Tax=Gemmatimonas phototrophica TaxID=1379270 RepID=UPI0011AE3804|nr:hypothetical protein [Gemmatimonas phototrophica]
MMALWCASFPAQLNAQRPTAFRTDVAVTEATAARPNDDAPTRTAPITASIAPGGVAVVRVPVPIVPGDAAASAQAAISYSVTQSSGTRILGPALDRVLPLDRGRTSVPVTVALSQRQDAGSTEVALVTFRSASASVTTAVVIEVPRVNKLSLVVTTPRIAVSAGSWASVRVRISNQGNHTPLLRLGLRLPIGWKSLTDSLVSAPSGSTQEAVLRWRIPAGATVGLHPSRVVLLSEGVVVAEAPLSISITVPSEVQQGVTVDLTSMAIHTPTASPAAGYGLAMHGQLTDSVQIDLRGTFGYSQDQAAAFGLARAGLLTMPPMLSLQMPSGGISAGALNVGLRDPAGAFVAGYGSEVSWNRRRWRLGGFGGVPFGQMRAMHGLPGTGRGTLAGAHLDRGVWSGRVGLEAAAVDDARMWQRVRSLTLYGSDLSLGGGQLSAAAAVRSLGNLDGSSLALPGSPYEQSSFVQGHRRSAGASAAYSRQTATSAFDVRVVHAPGTNQRFARAGSEASGNLSHRFSATTQVASGGWLQHDAASAIGRMQTVGWFVTPSWSPTSWGILNAELRGSTFAVQSGPIGYHNDEQTGAISADLQTGIWYARVRTSYGVLARRTSADSFSIRNARGRRGEHQVRLGVRHARGTIDVSWAALGFQGIAMGVARQDIVSVRMDRLTIAHLFDRPVELMLDAQRALSAADRAGGWMVHSEVAIPLPGTTRVVITSDRNPFLRLLTGGPPPMTYGVRLEQRARLPQFRRGASGRRRVFVDHNGNQRFDGGDEPLPAIAIECAGVASTTDLQGMFSCPGHLRSSLDLRTVPLGLVAPANIDGPHDVALQHVQPIVVALRVSAADSTRLAASELRLAILSVRDDQGTRWQARMETDGRFIFDALPAGHYVLDFDPGAMREPATLVGAPPEIVVSGQATPALLTVDVRPRPLRLKTLAPMPPKS